MRIERIHRSLEPERFTEAELAYTAGIVDGEGSIGLYKQTGRTGNTLYHLKVSVTNTDYRMGEWLVKRFGGGVSPNNVKHPNHKDSDQWIMYGLEAARFLELIRPYLILKVGQAALASEFASTGLYFEPTDSILECREALFIGMAALNKRGRR